MVHGDQGDQGDDDKFDQESMMINLITKTYPASQSNLTMVPGTKANVDFLPLPDDDDFNDDHDDNDDDGYGDDDEDGVDDDDDDHGARHRGKV